MPRVFTRPDVDARYTPTALGNSRKYEILTNNREPASKFNFDDDFNYLLDAANLLSQDIDGVIAGTIPGSDDPANAEKLLTTDGGGNLSWVFIDTDNMEDDAITSSKISDGAILARHNSDGSVPSRCIQANAVTADKVPNRGLPGNKLGLKAISEAEMEDNSVPSRCIQANAVTADKVPNRGLPGNKLSLNTVTSDELDVGAVTQGKIGPFAILEGNIADLQISSRTLRTDIIDNSHVKTNANILGDKLNDRSIGQRKLTLEVLKLLQPVGMVIPWFGGAIPSYWIECNGQAISRGLELFQLWGTKYGNGDGVNSFNLPDLRGRTLVHISSNGDTGGRVTTATMSQLVVGGVGGVETVTLNTNQIPQHTHPFSITTAFASQTGSNTKIAGSSAGDIGAYNGTTGATGSTQAHSNMQPSFFCTYIVKYRHPDVNEI